MKRKFKVLIVAACAVVVLAIAEYVVSSLAGKEEPPEEEPTVTAEYPLIDGDLAALRGFTIASGETALTLTSEDDEWFIEGAEDVPLAYIQTDYATLYASHLTAYEKLLDKAVNLAEYGLAPPYMTIASRFDAGEQTAHIGALSADGGYRYAMAEGDDALYMVYTNSLDYFDPTGDAYVYKPIRSPELDIGDVMYLRLERQNQPTVEFVTYDPSTANPLETYHTGSLLMTAPVKNRPVYMDNAQSLIIEPFTKLYMDRLTDIAPKDLAAYGLDSPRMRLAIETLEGAYTLVVGNEQDGMAYVKTEDNGCVFVISAESLRPLLTVNSFVCAARFVSILDIGEVESIDIRLNDETYHCEINNYVVPGGLFNGDDAEEIAPTIEGRPIDPNAFKDFYVALIGMSYEALADPPEPSKPSAKADIEVVFKMTGGKTVTDRLYKRGADFYAIWSDYFGEDTGVDYLISRLYIDRMTDMLVRLAR